MTIQTHTALNLADIKSSPTSNVSILYDTSIWNWNTGNFSGQADDVNIIKADSTSISNGAWVRQTADSVIVKRPGATSRRRTVGARLADFATLNDWNGNFDSEHLNRALTEFAAQGGGVLQVLPGSLSINDKVTIPEKVELRGSEALCSKSNPAGDLATHRMVVTVGQGSTTTPAIVLKTNSGISGFTMFWPAQSRGAAAIPFGWAMTSDGTPFGFDRVSIRNMMLTNPYWGINADSGGQWLIENIYGQPLRRGIRIDRMLDRSVIDNVHWFTFFSTPGDVLFDDIRANSHGFQIGKTDDLVIDKAFAYGLNRFMSFEDFGNGASWSKISNAQSDACQLPVYVEKSNKIQISNLGLTANGAAQSGLPGIYFGADIAGEVIVQGTTVYNTPIGAHVLSNSGKIRFTDFVCQRFGRPDDVKQYDFVIEGGAEVHIDDVPASRVAGGASVRVGNFMLPPATTDITPDTFGTPYSWASNPAVTNNGGSSDFDLSATVNGTTQFAVPADLLQERGVFVLVAPLQWFPGPNGYGPGQFYLRISDGVARNDLLFPSSPFDGHFRQKVSLNIPFILRGDATGLKFQFVFGGGQAGNVMRLGAMKIYRADYRLISRQMLDWLHQTTSNSAGDDLDIDFIAGRRVTRRSAPPTAGYHRKLDRVINSEPALGNRVSWTNTIDGKPGTWLADGTFS